jgi:flavin-binding protein dodecin
MPKHTISHEDPSILQRSMGPEHGCRRYACSDACLTSFLWPDRMSKLSGAKFALRGERLPCRKPLSACCWKRSAASLQSDPLKIAVTFMRVQLTSKGSPHAPDSVYRIVDVVGVSEKSWEDAGRNAVETAAGSLRDLRVAEVTKMDIRVENGKVTAFRTRVAL